jgi:hypothetical protein
MPEPRSSRVPPRDPARPPPAPAAAPSRRPLPRLRAVVAFLLFLATIRLAVAYGPAVLLVHVFCGLACAGLARSRGRRPWVWLHGGLVFGVFALDRLVRRPSRTPPPAGTVEAGVSFVGVLDFLLLCGLAQSVVGDRILATGRLGETKILALIALFAASAVALVWINRSALFRYLTSVKTSVALVTYLGLGSLAMTLILQQPDAEKAWLQDEKLATRTHDDLGRPMSNADKEYVKFMAAETGLAYGARHLFEGPPPPTAEEREEEKRLAETFGPAQGHNIASRNAHDRFLRRRALEKQALADETGDALRPFFEFCRATRLYEIRRAWWFVVGILDLLAVCLVLVCVDRWKRGTKRYAFYFAHAGLVLVIFGRHFTDDEGTFLAAVAGESRRGNLELLSGAPENLVKDDFLRPVWRLPFEVRLDRFEVDYYKHWAVRVEDERLGLLSNNYLPRGGKKVDVFDRDGGHWTLDALEHHLSADVDRRLVEDAKGPWRGALRATVTIPGAPMMKPRAIVLVPDLPEASEAHLGQISLEEGQDDTYLRAVWAEDDAAFEREARRTLDEAALPFGRLEVRTDAGRTFSVDVPERPGDVETRVDGVGRVRLHVELVTKDLRQALKNAERRGSLALWQQSEGEAAVQGRLRFLGDDFTDVAEARLVAWPSGGRAVSVRGDRDFDAWSFRFVREPGPVMGSFNAKVVLGPGGRAALVLPGGGGAVPLEVGKDAPVGSSGASLRPDAILGRCAAPLVVTPRDERDRSRVEDDFSTARHDYVSATRLRVTPPAGKGEPVETWITSVDRWPLRFGPSGSMSIALEEEFGNARDYRSYVTILEGSKPVVKDGVPVLTGRGVETRDGVEALEGGHVVVPSTLVQVNDPLWWRGYKLYQSRYNANVPEFSGLIAKRDRGLWWVYVGIPLTFFGILWMLVVDPALARRRSRRRPAAPPARADA